jgi:general secretion pathway protein C
MFVRVCAFVIWALVAGTVVFWGLRLLVRAPEAPAHAVAVGAATVVKGDLARLLGAAPVATAAAAEANPEASSRFRLLGVMAPKAGRAEASGQGFALIAVDGKPPRAFAVGAQLDTDLVLQAVSLRTASIGPPEGAASVRLEIPPFPAPATGTLLSAATMSSSVAPPPMLPPPVPAQAIPSVAPPLMVAPPAPQSVAPVAAPTVGVPTPGSGPTRRDFGNANR